MTEEIPVILKWSKKTFDLTIKAGGESALSFKKRVQTLTGVPVERQKLLLVNRSNKGGSIIFWKGALKDDVILDTTAAATTTAGAIKTLPLIVTLIGSAETLSGGPKQHQTTTFIEDMTVEELQAAEDAQAQAALKDAIGMIPALQFPPVHRRQVDDDGKQQEMCAYNRLVTGLPQRQIEQELLLQQQRNDNSNSSSLLQGKVAMTLGMELRRAYVNDLAVLMDGTCISAMDDGHVLLWKHGAQQHDVVHYSTAATGGSGGDGGVDSVVALSNHEQPGAFATAGRGVLQIWKQTSDDDSVKPVVTLTTAMPGTSPASLVSISFAADGILSSNTNTITCVAARYKVTRQTNSSQFHLTPQNEAERQRRIHAQEQEQFIQQGLARAACCINLWFGSSVHTLQSRVLSPPETTGSASVTCLAAIPSGGRDGSVALLAVGDALGGLRLWKLQFNNDRGRIDSFQQGFYQLVPASGSSGCSIVCLQSLHDGRLAVSTNVVASGTEGNSLWGAEPIAIPTARAVHILDFSQQDSIVQTTLNGHANDAVICMCELPNGDMLTGGGRLDATLQLWTKEQVIRAAEPMAVQTKAHKTLSDVGYVFALAVLPDVKNDSKYFAVAAARYNTVKIIL